MTEASSPKSPAIQQPILPAAPEPRPNRVILRMRVREFDEPRYSWFAYSATVEKYLSWAGPSVTDYKERKHNVFVEPFQDPELKQRHFHIIIDFYSLSFDVQDLNQVHHEICQIGRDDKEELQVFEIKQPKLAENLIRKIREVTDERIPWGTDKTIQTAQNK